MTDALPARFAHLRLRDLMLLEHLDDLGSLTGTAQRMHVTQSAITQALRSLEQGFGEPLVERGRRGQRGVTLTPAGKAALLHLRVAHNELRAALEAAAGPERPNLRIGALPLTLVELLPKALESLRRRLPQVHVQLAEDTLPNLWRRLAAGEFDAIVSRLPALSENPRLPPGVAHRSIGEDVLVLVCGRAHPIARRRAPTLAMLREHDWVLPPEGSYTRLTIDRAFMSAGLPGPRAAITSMNFHTNLRLVAGGTLLAVAPRAAALAVRKPLDLAIFPIDWGGDDPAITLVWRKASLGNPALAALLDYFGQARASRPAT